jgi:predicted small secreted protein
MRLILVMILLAAITLSGCNGTGSNVNSNGNGNANAAQNFKPPTAIKPVDAADPTFQPCNPYFPLVPGSVAKYVINYSSGLVGDLTVVVDATDEDGRKVFTQRSQLVDRSGGMKQTQSIVRRFVCDGDRVQILSEKTETNVEGQLSSSEFEFRENSLVMTDPKSVLTKGSTWTHVFRTVFHVPGQAPARSDQPTVIAFEVGSPEHLTTAIGTFRAVPISRKIGENLTVDYYVAGLGLVKRQSKEGTSWEIKEYSGLKPQD